MTESAARKNDPIGGSRPTVSQTLRRHDPDTASTDDILIDAFGIELAEVVPDPKDPECYDLVDIGGEIFSTLAEAKRRVSEIKKAKRVIANYWYVQCPSLDCRYEDIEWVDIFEND